MLVELHTILQRLLYERGQISPQEVEIRFEAPTREFIERLMLPTINLFLFEIQENTELRQSSHQTVRANGRAERRLPPKRFDLHFMVCALSSEIEDEHLLLWRALTTLIRHPQIPEELLPETVRALDIPLVTQLGQKEESDRLLNVWSSLGAQPRPALAYTVTVPVDLAVAIEVPLVLTRVARYTRLSRESSAEISKQLGGIVRNQKGEALVGVHVSIEGHAQASITNAEGRFVLSNVPDGQVNLLLVPEDGKTHAITITSSASQSAQAADRTQSYEIIL